MSEPCPQVVSFPQWILPNSNISLWNVASNYSCPLRQPLKWKESRCEHAPSPSLCLSLFSRPPIAAVLGYVTVAGSLLNRRTVGSFIIICAALLSERFMALYCGSVCVCLCVLQSGPTAQWVALIGHPLLFCRNYVEGENNNSRWDRLTHTNTHARTHKIRCMSRL